MLNCYNLSQHVQLPTRVTLKSSTLIDHVISNVPNRVTYTNVLPCSSVSDHDAPYVCINVRVKRFQPRYKMIRNEREFDEEKFLRDFSELPFNLIYSTDDIDDKLALFNSLFTSCLDGHAPLKKVKVTRPPAPWLKSDDIHQLQVRRNQLRYQAHQTKSEDTWIKFREVRNLLRTKIKQAKRLFYQKALSSKSPKELWRTIHRILNPSTKPIRADADELNRHFSNTTQRILGTKSSSIENLRNYINSFSDHKEGDPFVLRKVTFEDIERQLENIRTDCATGPDQIPSKYIKIVTEYITSPLTNIINECIDKNIFPKAWKTSRISPVPKVDNPRECDDYRPIAILPMLSKVYERLVLSQIKEHIDRHNILHERISGYRKGHSTTTVLLRFRDDILRAMKRGELTMAIFADFSKAFDTVDHTRIVKKMHNMGFSKHFLHWILSYIGERRQFVQINDKTSELVDVQFGVPQGSILGPVLFNFYANDLNDIHDCTAFQYADDTTFIKHCAPSDLDTTVGELNSTMRALEGWSSNSNLLLNAKKTKQMLISTDQMSRVHKLEDQVPQINANGEVLERVTLHKFLGVWIQENLKWTKHVTKTVSSCFAALSVIKKIRNMVPKALKKQLVEALVLSKVDYNDIVVYPLPQYLETKLQRVQKSAASFVNNRYAKMADVIGLGWLPVKERTEMHLLRTTHRALYDTHWPSYLTLQRRQIAMNLRSCATPQLVVPFETGTFQDSASRLFNSLPNNIKLETNAKTFARKVFKFLKTKAELRLD